MNDLNKVFQGFFQGAEQVGTALAEKNRKNQLSELYSNSMSRLNQLLNPQATYTQDGQNIPRSQVSQNMLNGVQSEQSINPDFKGAMNLLYEQAPEFLNQGEQGKQYLGMLEDFYKSNIPTQPEYDIREVSGQLLKYDKNNPNNIEVLYGEPKKEKKKNTAGDYAGMTLEQVQALDPNEIENAFYYFNPEVQAKLKENPYFQQLDNKFFKEGDYAPKLGGIKRGGKIGKINLPDKLDKDENTFGKLDDYNERIRGGENLTDTEKENYNTVRLRLGQKYNLNDTELSQVIDRLNEATTEKEKKQIMQSLDKGSYYNDVGTNQEQIDYDRNRILEWQQALNDAYSSDPSTYDGYKQSFLKELQDFYQRGSITKKEYDDLRKSYF